MVEMLTTRTNGFMKTTSPMKLVLFTRQEVGTTVLVAVLWLSVAIANLVKLATFLRNTILTVLMSMDMCTENKPWWMNCTNVVPSFALSQSLNLSMIMLVEFTTTPLVTSTQFTKSRLLVGARRTALSSGTSEILGEHTGEKMGSSELLEELIILL